MVKKVSHTSQNAFDHFAGRLKILEAIIIKENATYRIAFNTGIN